VKVVCGLGNPGSRYARTRHNVGWWLVDLLAARWSAEPFGRAGAALVVECRVADEPVALVKPQTYMNLSGHALVPWLAVEGFDVSRDLLVVVDDVALAVGRARIRGRGSAGGHNGLKSVESVLGTQDYARLRIGVGAPPAGEDLADWVLSPFPPEEEGVVVELLSRLDTVVERWIAEGVEAAAGELNRRL